MLNRKLSPEMRKAFEELIEKYSLITEISIQTILDKHFHGKFPHFYSAGKIIMNKMTGFGSKHTCTLCKVATKEKKNRGDYKESKCEFCYVLFDGNGCNDEVNSYSYNEIYTAKSSGELIFGLKRRIYQMKKLLRDYDEEK